MPSRLSCRLRGFTTSKTGAKSWPAEPEINCTGSSAVLEQRPNSWLSRAMCRIPSVPKQKSWARMSWSSGGAPSPVCSAACEPTRTRSFARRTAQWSVFELPSGRKTMFPFKRSCFPLVFFEHCIAATRLVEAMTGCFEAELVLLRVLEPARYYGLPETVEAAETRLAMFQRDEFRCFRVRWMVEKGDDATEKILAVSRAENMDLIMMPTSG